MAYNKRNWKARQGTGLNFFSIDGATPVPIVNQPTTLTEAGDALSAGNLNDWEQRIADGFDSASGELADAVEELESEDTALRSAITANSNRIANLEQKAGDYSIVQYRGTDAVPTGKAKYGLVKSIVGKTRAWNQLFNSSACNANSRGLSFTYDGTEVSWSGTTTSGTTQATILTADPILISGHTYLMRNSNPNICQIRITDGNNHTNTDNNTFIVASTLLSVNIRLYGLSGETAYSGSAKVIIRDLTLIFPEGVPATVAECVKKCPDLLKWDAHDAGSLVDTVVSGVESKARNLFNINDFDSINGYFNDSVIASSADRKIVYVPCKPNTVYCATRKAVVANERFSFGFSSELPAVGVSCSNIVSATQSQTIGATMTITATSPSDAKYLVCWVYWDNTTSALDSLCINKSDSLDGTFTPFFTDTLSLSTPVTLRSAGSVAEVLTLETGKKTRPIKTVDLGSDITNWGYDSTYAFFYTSLSDKAYGTDFLCDAYVNAGQVLDPDMASVLTMSCATNGGVWFYIKNTSKNASDLSGGVASWLVGVKLNYALATPLPDEQVCDPIIDNTIYTEGGGTIDTIQEQSPIIDNCLDVGYLAV